MTNAVVALVTGKTDVELAAAHKKAVIEALQPTLDVLNAAKRDGFVISFVLGQDFLGSHVIQTLTIAKNF